MLDIDPSIPVVGHAVENVEPHTIRGVDAFFKDLDNIDMFEMFEDDETLEDFEMFDVKHIS